MKRSGQALLYAARLSLLVLAMMALHQAGELLKRANDTVDRWERMSGRIDSFLGQPEKP